MTRFYIYVIEEWVMLSVAYGKERLYFKGSLETWATIKDGCRCYIHLKRSGYEEMQIVEDGKKLASIVINLVHSGSSDRIENPKYWRRCKSNAEAKILARLLAVTLDSAPFLDPTRTECKEPKPVVVETR